MYTEDYNEHMHNLGVCQSEHTIMCWAKAAVLLSFDVLVLEISQGLLSILWYRWTFQGKGQFVVGILPFSEVSIADNSSQG